MSVKGILMMEYSLTMTCAPASAFVNVVICTHLSFTLGAMSRVFDRPHRLPLHSPGQQPLILIDNVFRSTAVV